MLFQGVCLLSFFMYVFIYFCSYSFVTIDQSYFLRYLGQLSKFCQGFIYLFLFGKLISLMQAIFGRGMNVWSGMRWEFTSHDYIIINKWQVFVTSPYKISVHNFLH